MSKLSATKIGITGTIGSGKSSVTKIISKFYPTISADAVVKEFYKEKSFIKMINKEILNIDSDLFDSKAIADVIFSDDLLKHKLENIIHPLVRDYVFKWLSIQNGLCFVEVPLMFEAKFEDLFDKILIVVTDEKIIYKRLARTRNYTKEETLARINQQLPVKDKIIKSDYVIYNNSTYNNLKRKTKSLLNNLEKGE